MNQPNPYTSAVMQNNEVKPKRRRLALPSVSILVALMIILQAVAIVLTINPPYMQQANLTKQVIDEVAAKTKVNPFETPVMSVVADADNLKKANEIQGQVYANAQNGDYVLGYTDKMVIYRRPSGEIVYEGDSPGTILNKNQENLTNAVLGAATTRGLIGEGEQLTPQMSVVTDVELLQKQDPTFYKSAQKGDVIAIFPTKQLILLLRAGSTGDTQIIQSGEYQTNIKTI